jgi:gamma-glutamylcyclotransferase (GGCT)/AIG2-like uncharacterized protein YtfP
MNPNIFVYGSLMSSSGHPMGDKLRREATLIGQATIQGRLYRVTWYPGLVDGETADERVHGEVYALRDAAASLRWLDEYEGIDAAKPASSQYRRVERPVRIAAGQDAIAWVYLYQGDCAALSRIAEGRWRPKAP